MKSKSHVFASLVVSASWLAVGAVAQAVPPLPHTRIDVVERERHERIAMLHVLPEWAQAELGRALSVDENAVGYFARSIRLLEDRLDRPGGGKEVEKRGKKRESKKERGGTAAEPSVPRELAGGRPEMPGNIQPGTPGKYYEDPRVLPEPLERAFGNRPPHAGRPASGGEVPEPSGHALLAIAMAGLLAVARPRTRP